MRATGERKKREGWGKEKKKRKRRRKKARALADEDPNPPLNCLLNIYSFLYPRFFLIVATAIGERG